MENRLCTEEQLKERYYPAECENCHFKGSSSEWTGGGQIADTGDYDDSYCPRCGSPNYNEIENEIRIPEIIRTEEYLKGWTDCTQVWLKVHEDIKGWAKVWGEKIYTQEDLDYAIEKAKREVRYELTERSWHAYCQSAIEDKGPCREQCDHCKEYYKPIQHPE